MRARKIRQPELFDDDPPAPVRALPPQVRAEALQLLTQWLHTLSKTMMVQESGDEQDRG
jgi:hypothetical protein